jgi:tetratricopeptide (TPR) repeat protein
MEQTAVPSGAEILAVALQRHQAGDFQQAELGYRQVLYIDPNHADAYHLLGVVASQTGRFDLGIAMISRALTLNPNVAIYHYNLASAHEILGHLEAAEESYERTLSLQPDFPEAHVNLGKVLFRQRRVDDATSHFNEALRQRPDCADAHCNLGAVFAAQGDVKSAVDQYRKALLLNPDFAEAHNNLAQPLLSLGQVDEAVAHSRHAMNLRPDWAEAHHNLGVALQQQNKLDEAAAHLHEALRLRPGFLEAMVCLGNVLVLQNRLDEAAIFYRKAFQLQPDCAEAFNGLGLVFERQDNLGDAFRCCQEALRLKPDFPDAINNLGIVLLKQDKLDEAIDCFRQALSLKACFAAAYYHWGMALERQGKFAGAIRCYDDAIRVQPTPPLSECRNDAGSHSALAYWNRALVMLLLGDFEHGWPEYEWRWTQPGFTRSHVHKPLWDGSGLGGQRILLHCEQGLGDTIQFIRYAPIVKQHGGTVIIECNRPLMRLLSGLPGIDHLVANGGPLPAFDIQAPLLSLPGILRTSLDAIPAAIPYLHADRVLITHWRNELASLDGFRIGIAWQGNAAYRNDRQRSIPLTHFAPLAELAGVRLISLQKGPGTDQLLALDGRFAVHDFGDQFDEANGAFMDTAAIMKNLDLVICSDSAIAHLAGALGVPVWLVLPAVPDWRWMLEREDSPWYPTMRLFRQTKAGDWDEVFKRIGKMLRDYAPKRITKGSQR